MRYVIVVLLFLTGCQSMRPTVPAITRKPPLIKEFWKIKAEPYIEHLYDCSNKSSKYCRMIREKGYNADILITRVNEGHHAVVVVRFGNKDVLYCDPTQGTWSTEIDEYGAPETIVMFEDRFNKEKWAGEFIETF
jgi:hypothetical protein